jgi:hypothetical protein
MVQHLHRISVIKFSSAQWITVDVDLAVEFLHLAVLSSVADDPEVHVPFVFQTLKRLQAQRSHNLV